MRRSISSVIGDSVASGRAVDTGLALIEIVSSERSVASAKTSMVPSAWSAVSRGMSLS